MQTVASTPIRGISPLPLHLMAVGDPKSSPLAGGDSQLVRRQGIQTVLIADDSQTERVHLSRILQEAGYQVLVASSGNEAKALAEKHEPDVIFLDIIMEDGDGYQTCRNIRRNPATAEIPIIMVSSKSNPVDIKWAEKLGANRYVVKPYTSAAILGELARL